MKLSELRVCDGCNGPLMAIGARWFQVVRTSGALVTPGAYAILRAASRHGVPLARVEVDSASGTDPVVIVGDQSPGLMTELLLCVSCYHTKPIAELARRRQERLEVLVARGLAS